jgi:UDP:flavonoid glycosyltransferase YjiC (YdhE family)
MANIVFLMLPERGHLISSFKIAKTLMSRGHRVYYLQIPEFEEYIISQGLEFIPLFESIFPKQYRFCHSFSTMENLILRVGIEATALGMTGLAVMKKEVRSALERINAHLLVQDINTEINPGVLEIEIPCIILNSTIISRPVYTIPEVPILVLCPEEFDLPQAKRTAQHYVEASIDLQRKEVAFPWDNVREDKRLIYCSLGTQSQWSHSSTSHESNLRTRKNFLRAVINVMVDRPDLQLILSAGGHLYAQELHDLPSNIIIVDSAPQIEILKRASLAITHGGLNTIKECIFFGTPMIVFPLAVDQFKNAECVVHHQLGLKGDIEIVSESVIHSLIEEIDSNPVFRCRMKIMRELFRKAENDGRAITIIESALNSGPIRYSPIFHD